MHGVGSLHRGITTGSHYLAKHGLCCSDPIIMLEEGPSWIYHLIYYLVLIKGEHLLPKKIAATRDS